MALVIAFPDKNRPICTKCNKNFCCMSGNPRKDGSRYFKPFCQGCYTEQRYGKRNALKKPWHYKGQQHTKYKKDKCELCGFIPKYLGQLDVDHVDGNHKNNNPANLQTLCANCHRLKTIEAKDYLAKPWRKAS